MANGSNNYAQKFRFVLSPDLIDERFENFLRNLKIKRSNRIKVTGQPGRINELSRPKRLTSENLDDSIGPGSYNPKDKFLSTKNRTPSIKIGKSSRFRPAKIEKLQRVPSSSSRKSVSRSLNVSDSWTPSYSFKRTGHNLKLVENIGNPGVGRYSPESTKASKAYTFKRSEREFNWKNNIRKMYQISDFEKRYWK